MPLATPPTLRQIERSDDGNVVSLLRPGCAQLFMLYAGRSGFLGTPMLNLLRETGLGNRNLTLLRDPHDDSYFSGIGDEAADLDTLLHWHRAHLRERAHVHELYCMGNSAGAVAALMFGSLLGAERVWAFSPRPATRDSFEHVLDCLLETLQANERPRDYQIYFCPDDALDSEVAQELGRCPGVSLHPREAGEHTHLLMAAMTRRGELRSLFPGYRPADDTSRD
jgi:hypothetical protein